MISRRSFLRGLAGGAIVIAPGILDRRGTLARAAEAAEAVSAIRGAVPDEDVFRFIRRQRGAHDTKLYARILGAANDFKDGDGIVGVAALDDASRRNARALLAKTRLSEIDAHPLHPDGLFEFISSGRNERAQKPLAEQTLAQFKQFLLTSDEAAIKKIMPGLSSDVISCVVKLMSND